MPIDWLKLDGGRIRLACGDCLKVLPTLEAGSVDCVVTDPPYGIGYVSILENLGASKHKAIAGDGGIDLRSILNMPCRVVAFGANCYPNQLPHRGRWICWDKRVNENADRMLGSSFELAWTNKQSGYDKFYRVMHGGVVNADGHGIKRVHPTQKPVVLMDRIICDNSTIDGVIFDPFMGSGTTGVACVNTGRKFIGIELDRGYFDIAVKRIQAAIDERDSKLFTQPTEAIAGGA
jgi:DNA modification methylase